MAKAAALIKLSWCGGDQPPVELELELLLVGLKNAVRYCPTDCNCAT
jgi:hypothetical protein